MALELVTPLPPGAPSHTRLAKHGVRLVVLRELKDGTDCSWPEASPNMVTLQEVGELQGKRHALFPWVPGVTLREVVKALEVVGKPTPIGLVGRVVIDAARALSTITPARPHGGIQDAAMQIGFDGKVSVLDFGAPRISRFRPLGRVNFAADVFALGGVVHATLTGFQGDYASPPVSLALPSNSHAEATPAVDDVVMRALSQQPDSRQPDAASFADELESVLADQLYTPAKLAEVVGTLFKDRIKVLHSLGGLIQDAPNLEAVLPEASQPLPIPSGTQPGRGGGAWPGEKPEHGRSDPERTGGPRPEPPSEPTLPRIALGDEANEANERTDVRIAIPPEVAAGSPSRSMVPWDSGENLTPAGPRPSGVEVPRASEPATNPRAELPTRDSDEETNPRASSPRPNGKGPADTDESSLPRPRASAPRPLGAEDEHSATLAAGPRALSRVDVPKATVGSRDDDSEASRTAALELPEETNPRARPRANVRPADSEPDLGNQITAAGVPGDTNPGHDDTAPRARPPRLEEDEGPTPGTQPRIRNTTEAERLRALGQERLRTPPTGTPVVQQEDEEEIRDEPTAVKNKPRLDPRMTAVTAQQLKPAPAPESDSGGNGLRILMVVLLLVVVGLAAGVVLKLKRESEQPLPLDEPIAEAVDAGLDEPIDAGQLAAPLPNLELPDEAEDGGEEEEEDDDLDGGAEAAVADAGLTIDAGVADGGTVDAGTKAPVKKPVKKAVKKKKKKKRR